ncbi:MAG: entericidin A/B family lipoprotein [Hyphomonadaceae bacterium]
MLRKAILVAMLAVTLGACNTIAGIGKDVSAAGDAVSDAADDAK